MAPAIIKLETINKRTFWAILIVTYTAAGVALLLSARDEAWRLQREVVEDRECGPGPVRQVNCTLVDPDSGVPVFVAELPAVRDLNYFFYVSVAISDFRVPGASDSELVRFVVDVEGGSGPGNLTFVSPTNSNRTIDRRFSCPDGSRCTTETLFIERPTQRPYYRVAIEFPDRYAFRDFGDVTYSIWLTRPAYAIVEIVFRSTLLVITPLVTLLWLREAMGVPYRTWLPEQWWVVVLLVGCFLLNDPFFIPKSIVGGTALLTLSYTSVTLSYSIFLWFWLCMAAALRSGEREFPAAFYRNKVLFAVVYSLVNVGLLMFSLFLLPVVDSLARGRQDPSRTLPESEFFFFVTLQVIKAVLALSWGIWFVRLTYGTYKQLKVQSYISTRFRQLSFRFFILQGSLVIAYTVVGSALSSQTPENPSLDYEPLGNNLLFSVYIYMVAFVYLPATQHKRAFRIPILDNLAEVGAVASSAAVQRAQRVLDYFGFVYWEAQMPLEGVVFCAETAQMLVRLADAVYFDPKGTTTASGSGEMDLTKTGFRLCMDGFVHDEATDTTGAVMVGQGRLVVAFRGTSSLTNAATDLKVSRVDWEYRVRADGNAGGGRQGPSLGNWGAWYNPMTMVNAMRAGVDAVEGMLDTVASKVINTVVKPKVHGGFWRAYQSVSERMLAVTLSSLAGHFEPPGPDDPPVQIFVTGHSLGGSLACLAAHDLQAVVPPGFEVILYTFGAPRVGNHSFANIVNHDLPHAIRVCHDKDIVPTVPKLGRAFKHAGIEVQMDEQGNIIADPSYIEKWLRSSRHGFKYHQLKMYEAALELCFEQEKLADASAAEVMHDAAQATPAAPIATDEEDASYAPAWCAGPGGASMMRERLQDMPGVGREDERARLLV